MLSIYIFLILFVALIFVVYPLRHHIKQTSIIVLTFSVMSLTFYAYYGSYSDLLSFQIKEHNERQAKAALKQFKSPEEVINKLKEAIKQNPDSAKGWYLLGRLYNSQGMREDAKKAFSHAYSLDKKDLLIRFSLMESLYLSNGQQIKGDVKRLLDEILKEIPDQPDALNFMAIDAYQHHKYRKANVLLQRLIPYLPVGSKEHDMVLKTVAAIQKKIKKGEQHG